MVAPGVQWCFELFQACMFFFPRMPSQGHSQGSKHVEAGQERTEDVVGRKPVVGPRT